jgi:hypothetical protein
MSQIEDIYDDEEESRIVILNKDTHVFSGYINFIKYNVESKNIKYCKGDVANDFVIDSLYNCHYIFVNISNDNIRGFACVTQKDDYLYVNLICNLDYHPMTTRSEYEKFKGKDMISKIIEKGKELGLRHIKLKAIESVITYYLYLGFKLLHNPSSELGKKKLSANLKALRSKEEHIKESAAGKIFKASSGKFYGDKQQQKISAETIGERTEDIRSEGIDMIYDLQEMGGKRKKRNKKTKKHHIKENKRTKKNKK